MFYPDLPFTSRRPHEYLSAPDGIPLPEVTAHPVPVTAGPGDRALTGTCADLARALLDTTLTTTEGTRPVEPPTLPSSPAHVSQASAVRALLADLPDVLVGTANQLQGMERSAAVVLHPLAGYRDPNAFGTDLGRACVMLSRHRAHLTVVTDTATPNVLTGPDLDPAALTHRTAAQTAWVLALGGASLLPDLDTTGSTAAHMWGPPTRLLGGTLGLLARGHRQGTHDLVLAPSSPACWSCSPPSTRSPSAPSSHCPERDRSA